MCSPLLDETGVYVQAGSSLVKLSKQDGKILWRTLKDGGGMWGSVFSSPMFATLQGQRQLVVQTRAKLAGVNPANGEVLWEQPVEAFRGMNILTPVVHDDMLFTSTYGGKTIGFKVARNSDRYSVSKAWEHKAQGYMTTLPSCWPNACAAASLRLVRPLR
ncbi:MAG: PQQ-binding-like beta-propeller repeat protein [Limisphaerales bacterium]